MVYRRANCEHARKKAPKEEEGQRRKKAVLL
jgi:hypothetical protein